MKKIAVIILLIFYMIPAMGFSITTHFCAGRLAKVSFYADDIKACVCGKKKMNRNCCSSHTTNVKIKDTQRKDAAFEIHTDLTKKSTRLFYFPYSDFFIPANQVIKFHLPPLHAPPDRAVDDPIYILNRVFRI